MTPVALKQLTLQKEKFLLSNGERRNGGKDRPCCCCGLLFVLVVIGSNLDRSLEVVPSVVEEGFPLRLAGKGGRGAKRLDRTPLFLPRLLLLLAPANGALVAVNVVDGVVSLVLLVLLVRCLPC